MVDACSSASECSRGGQRRPYDPMCDVSCCEEQSHTRARAREPTRSSLNPPRVLARSTTRFDRAPFYSGGWSGLAKALSLVPRELPKRLVIGVLPQTHRDGRSGARCSTEVALCAGRDSLRQGTIGFNPCRSRRNGTRGRASH